MKLLAPLVFALAVGIVFSPVHPLFADDHDDDHHDHGGMGFTIDLTRIINQAQDQEKKKKQSSSTDSKPQAKKPEPKKEGIPANSCLTKLTLKNDDNYPVTYRVYNVPETKDTPPTLLAESSGPVAPGDKITLTPSAPQTEFGKHVRIEVTGTVANKQVSSSDVDEGKIVTHETGLNVIEVETKLCGSTPPIIGTTTTDVPPTNNVTSTPSVPRKDEIPKDTYRHELERPNWPLLEYLLPLLILIPALLVLLRHFFPPDYVDRLLGNTPPDDDVPDDNSYDDSSYDDSSYDDSNVPQTRERPKIPPIPIIPFWPRTEENPCDELIRLCEEAQARAKAAADAAAAARAAADQARADCAKAQAATQAAQQALDSLLTPPSEGSSWIEDDQGNRITSHDLDLERQAASEARGKYAAGEISAQELQDQLSQWGPEQGPAAMAARRAKEAQERAQKIADAQAKLAAAKKAQDEICGKVGPAEEKADELEDDADDAQEEADEICAEAKDCVRKREEPKPPVAPTPTPTPTPGPGGDPGPTDGGGGTVPPHDPPIGAPGFTPVRQRNSCCGKQFDQMFVDCLNRMTQRLRMLIPAEQTMGVFGRIKCGLLFLSLNGWQIDFFGDWDCPENNDMKCHNTVTIGGKCHPFHILSDFLYGYIAGYFGLGQTGTSMGGVAFKLAQYYLGLAKHPLQVKENTEPLPPPHWTEAQPAYRAGARLGARQYGFFFVQPVTVEDLKVDPEGTPLADIAVISSDSCHPCTEVATPQDVTKDFSRMAWSFPLSPLNPGLDEQPGPGSNQGK